MLAGGPISWRSGRQKLAAQSTAESELYALVSTAQTALWFRTLVGEIGFLAPELSLSSPTPLREDNLAAKSLAENNVITSRTRHISAKCGLINRAVKTKQLSIVYVQSGDNIANVLTKPLAKLTFQKEASRMVGARA